MVLTEQKVKQLYKKYKSQASHLFEKGNYSACLLSLKVAAFTGYYFYLGYKDQQIENLLKQLSEKIDKVDNYEPKSDNLFVFYDSFSIDNGGLVQQYLGALIASGYQILYITEKTNFLSLTGTIRSMLEDYGNAVIKVTPNDVSEFRKAQFVYNTIIESGTNKLLIQSGPHSAYANTAFYALPKEITRYKINLTDHTFWIGAGCFDYSFEFRPFGCTLSNVERGVPCNRLFYMPFYPIMNKTGFKGYPEEVEGKVVLFSGGAYYKVYDKDDTYFKMVKAILEGCDDVILLYAGIGDPQKTKEKIEEYGLQQRFLLLGQRSDITEVFEHCDIYLNTFPFGGGLMSQYAAQLGKPIVNYYTPATAKVEEFVCQQKEIDISDNTIDSLVERVRKLANNKDERIAFGKLIQSCVITPDEFNQKFKDCIRTGVNQIPYNDNTTLEEHLMDINDKLNFDADNKEYARRVSKIMGMKTLIAEPLLFFDAISVLLKGNRIIKALKNNLKK